jgi:isochorismate pyruvate lyase
MARDPHDCRSMSDLRAEIDRIDRALIALLARRAACIDRAATLKRAEGLPARIEDRIEEVVANARRAAEAGGLDAAAVAALWRGIVEWSVAREERALARDEAS